MGHSTLSYDSAKLEQQRHVEMVKKFSGSGGLVKYYSMINHRTLEAFLAEEDVPEAAYRVWFALVAYGSPNNVVLDVSLTDLARQTKRSLSSIQRAVAWLEERQFIQRHHDNNKPVIYALNSEDVWTENNKLRNTSVFHERR